MWLIFLIINIDENVCSIFTFWARIIYFYFQTHVQYFSLSREMFDILLKEEKNKSKIIYTMLRFEYQNMGLEFLVHCFQPSTCIKTWTFSALSVKVLNKISIFSYLTYVYTYHSIILWTLCSLDTRVFFLFFNAVVTYKTNYSTLGIMDTMKYKYSVWN